LFVLVFGRIRAYKDLDLVAQAMGQVQSSYPGARLLVAGEGEIAHATRAKLEKIHAVILNRQISDDEIPRLFLESRVVVLPYRQATYSAVAPLAWYFGRPVVATAVGGLTEMIRDGENGSLVPPGDAISLARAICRFLPDKKWKEANLAILTRGTEEIPDPFVAKLNEMLDARRSEPKAHYLSHKAGK